MVIFVENVAISEDIFGELWEIFGETSQAVRVVRAVRAIRVVGAVTVVGAVRVVRAQALYRLGVESKISLSHVLTATEETSQV